MLEWFYAYAIKHNNKFLVFTVPIASIFANSCELNPTLAILPILCILMKLLNGDSRRCTREGAAAAYTSNISLCSRKDTWREESSVKAKIFIGLKNPMPNYRA